LRFVGKKALSDRAIALPLRGRRRVIEKNSYSLLKKYIVAARSKMVRCKEAKKSRPRGVLNIHKRSGFFR
jgi:hypothetical protein